VWVLVFSILDYFWFFDLGLNTAVTNFCARYLAKGRPVAIDGRLEWRDENATATSENEGLYWRYERRLREIEDVGRRLETVSVRGGGAYNLAWQDWINLQSQTTAAWLIARSALERTESRGSHYRRDFPGTATEAVAVIAGYADGAGPKVWTEPVRYTRLRPDATRRPVAVDVGD